MILRLKLCSLVGGAALLSAPTSDAFAPVRPPATRAPSSSGTARHQQPPPQQPAQFYDANGNPVSMPMVYDSSGNLVPFNPMQQAPVPPPQAQMPPQVNPGPAMGAPVVEPPLPPKSKGSESPRPVGYNPDAYTISNTADVYFAQLKQDTKVRKMARMSGDIEKANQVFTDDSVKQIGESWVENPYTKEKNLAEARAEIEGTVRLQVAESEAPKLTSGVSYKEKLAQMKAGRTAGGGGGAPLQAPPKTEQPVATAPPKAEQPKATAPAPTKVIPQAPPKVGQQIPTNVVPPPPVVPTPPPKAAAAAAAPSGAMSEDDVRGKVRTLQGLLLKHRGGPGFGAGRLKAPEAQRLEDTLEEVKGILRSEVGGAPIAAAAPPKVPAQPAPVAAAVAPPKVPQAAPVVEKPKAVAVTPPPVQKSPVAPAPVKPASTPAPADPLAGSVACVEGAVQAYKAAAPAERKEAAMALVGALMAAASAGNKFIAESELEEHRAAMDAGPSAAVAAAANAAMGSSQAEKPMMGFPTSYAVTKPDEETVEPPVAVPASGPGENTKKLEEVYNALVNARGAGGKLGLKNISGDEATALKEKLQTMRTVLLDELNSVA